MSSFIIRIRAVPNASKSAVAGMVGDVVKIKLAAVPEDGKANAELLRFLAEKLELPKRAVTLESGASSRDKRVAIEGLDEPSVRARLGV